MKTVHVSIFLCLASLWTLVTAAAPPESNEVPADAPKLPRVLVIGDSISMNYHKAAKEALKGIANYHRIEGNGFSTVYGVENLDGWLGDYEKEGQHWDVIQFNHGLHDLKQSYDQASDTWGDYAVSLEAYKANLEKEIAILKRTGATLIWCSTTPVPNSNKGKYARRKGAARIFNDAAMEVMRRHPDIQINDLYAAVLRADFYDAWSKGTDVHYWKPSQQAVVGQAVTDAIKRALK